MHVGWGCPPLDRSGPSTGSSRWTGPHPHPLIRAHPAQGQADYRGVAISSCLSPSASVCTSQCSDPLLLSLLSQSLYFYISVFPSVSFSLSLYLSWYLSVSLYVFVFLRCLFYLLYICFSAPASPVSVCLSLSFFPLSLCECMSLYVFLFLSLSVSIFLLSLTWSLYGALSVFLILPFFCISVSPFLLSLGVSFSVSFSPHTLFILCLSSCVYLSLHLCSLCICV